MADLTARLRELIAQGAYMPGDRLPNFRQLMADYSIGSSVTLDRSLRDLESEGLITRRQGSGIFIRKRHTITRDLIGQLKLEHRRAASGEHGGGLFEATTATPADVETTYTEMPAPGPVAAALGLSIGAPVLRRVFRFITGGKPYQTGTSYMPIATARAANLRPENEVPGASTIAQLTSAGLNVDHVALHMAARMPSAAETAELNIPPGTPVFEHHRTMFAGDQPCETTVIIVPADRIGYVFNIDLTEPVQ